MPLEITYLRFHPVGSGQFRRMWTVAPCSYESRSILHFTLPEIFLHLVPVLVFSRRFSSSKGAQQRSIRSVLAAGFFLLVSRLK